MDGNTASAPSIDLRPGSRVGSFTVVRFDGNVLELRGHPGFSIMVMLAGLLASVWGVFPWLAFLTKSGQQPSIGAFCILPIGLFAIGAGIVQLMTRCAIDRAGRVVKVTAMFRGARSYAAQTYRQIVVTVHAANLQQRETIAVELPIIGGRFNQSFMLGIRRTDKPDAVNLVHAAVWIAAALGLPLFIEGESKKNPQLQASIDGVQASLQA